MPGELFTIDMLQDMAVMVMAVNVVVAFTKWLFNLGGVASKVAAWVTALIVVGLVYLNQGMTGIGAAGVNIATVVVLWILNSMVVASVAMKAFEEIGKPVKRALQSRKE